MQQSTAPDSTDSCSWPSVTAGLAGPWGPAGHGRGHRHILAPGTAASRLQWLSPMRSTHSTHTVPSQGAWQTSAPHVPATGVGGHGLIAAGSNQSCAALQCDGHQELNR